MQQRERSTYDRSSVTRVAANATSAGSALSGSSLWLRSRVSRGEMDGVPSPATDVSLLDVSCSVRSAGMARESLTSADEVCEGESGGFFFPSRKNNQQEQNKTKQNKTKTTHTHR